MAENSKERVDIWVTKTANAENRVGILIDDNREAELIVAQGLYGTDSLPPWWARVADLETAICAINAILALCDRVAVIVVRDRDVPRAGCNVDVRVLERRLDEALKSLFGYKYVHPVCFCSESPRALLNVSRMTGAPQERSRAGQSETRVVRFLPFRREQVERFALDLRRASSCMSRFEFARQSAVGVASALFGDGRQVVLLTGAGASMPARGCSTFESCVFDDKLAPLFPRMGVPAFSKLLEEIRTTLTCELLSNVEHAELQRAAALANGKELRDVSAWAAYVYEESQRESASFATVFHFEQAPASRLRAIQQLAERRQLTEALLKSGIQKLELELRLRLRDLTDARGDISVPHFLFSTLPFGAILTTNFDRLHEDAAAYARAITSQAVVNERIRALGQRRIDVGPAVARDGAARLVKLYGSIDDWHALAWNPDEFIRCIANQMRLVEQVVRDFSKPLDLVIVGHALADSELLSHLIGLVKMSEEATGQAARVFVVNPAADELLGISGGESKDGYSQEVCQKIASLLGLPSNFPNRYAIGFEPSEPRGRAVPVTALEFALACVRAVRPSSGPPGATSTS